MSGVRARIQGGRMRHARNPAALAVAVGTVCALAIGGALAAAGRAASATPAAPSKTKATGPPIETGPMRAPDLVEVINLDPSIRLDIRYATTNNFVGRPVYREARADLQRPAAEALARVSRA